MDKTLATALMLFTLFSAKAQEEKMPRWGVKFGYEVFGTELTHINVSKDWAELTETFRFLNFPLSFQIYNKKNLNYHELTLSRLHIPLGESSGKIYRGSGPPPEVAFDTTGNATVNFQVGIRYAYVLKLGKKNKRSQFYLEFPVEVFYHRHANRRFSPGPYYNSDAIGFSTGITPHYQFFVKPNTVFFDFAIPINAYYGMYAFTSHYDSATPDVVNKYSQLFNYSGSPFMSFRISLGIKL